MSRIYLILLLSGMAMRLVAQPQIDFRGLFSLNVEKKLTPELSLTGSGAALRTYDFRETGFAWADGGVKYKLTRNIGVNANYRLLFRRNLDNFYEKRHILYADIDWTKSRGNWSVGGTFRFQSMFYGHIAEGSRPPRFYNRDKINIRYKINYYWQPFAEAEVFVPIRHPVRKKPDQWRLSLGISHTFNRYIKVEFYEQLQQGINRSVKNTNFLTAVNWFVRF